jgi:hypothetical protein
MRGASWWITVTSLAKLWSGADEGNAENGSTLQMMLEIWLNLEQPIYQYFHWRISA